MLTDPVIGIIVILVLLWTLSALTRTQQDAPQLMEDDPSLFELVLLGLSVAYIVAYIQKYRRRQRLLAQHHVADGQIEAGNDGDNP